MIITTITTITIITTSTNIIITGGWQATALFLFGFLLSSLDYFSVLSWWMMMMIWLWEDVKKWWWTLLMAYQWYYSRYNITQLQFLLSIRCWWYTGHPPCHFYLRRWKFIFYKENERESKARSFTGMLKVHLGEASAIDLPFTYEVKNLRCSLKTLTGMFDFIRKYLKHEIL